MAIDPKMTVEEYLEQEVAYCAKHASINIPPLNFATLQGQDEFAAFPITSRDFTLIHFDPYAEKVAKSLGKVHLLWDSRIVIHGMYPHPRLVTGWFYFREIVTVCTFFVVIHLHPNKKVREEARKIQALYYEMHIGAARLVGFKTGMQDRHRSSTLIGSIVDGNKIDKDGHVQLWNYRLTQLAKIILNGTTPVLTLPREDESLLESLSAMHSQRPNLCQDVGRGADLKKDKGVEFFLRVHRPLIEYVVACQKLFEHVDQISSLSALWRGNHLAALEDDLQACIDHYEDCLSIHNELAYPTVAETSDDTETSEA